MRFAGKVAIVTGSTRGIGRAIAEAFVRDGARVVINGRDAVKVEQAVKEIGLSCACPEVGEETGRSGCVVGARADVASREEAEEMVQAALRVFGQVDILVNNAAIYEIVSLREMTGDQWDRMLGVNLKGVFNCTKAALEPMIAQGRGVIVNVASDAGKTGGFLPVAHYAASKAAVMSLTRSTAREFAPLGIRVNAVSPGVIETEMVAEIVKKRPLAVPLGRIGTPAEVAQAVLFLASDDSSYITGEIMDVNGGVLID